jgi:hypothetical protein
MSERIEFRVLEIVCRVEEAGPFLFYFFFVFFFTQTPAGLSLGRPSVLFFSFFH